MNCIIPGPNLKVVGKALQALSRIGDEVYLEAGKTTLSLITLNMSKTVCGRFNFLDSFFSSYEIDENELGASADDPSGATLTCKVHMKILLPLFRGNLEKKLDFFKLEYDPSSDFIVFKMKYKCDDLLMSHKMRLMESETLSIGIATDAGTNNICATSSFFNQLLTMFNVSDDEITLEITKLKAIARNYYLGAPYRPKTMRSQINLTATDFTTYSIQTDTTVNFSLKPFRTAIHFADYFNLNVGFNFETGGKPLTVIMKSPTYDVNFIIATLNPYNDMQSSMTTTSIPSSIISKRRQCAATTDKKRGDAAALAVMGGDLSALVETEESEAAAAAPAPPPAILMGDDKENGADAAAAADIDIVPKSPETTTPQSKRARTVFGRCYDTTFNGAALLGEVLAGNSDSE